MVHIYDIQNVHDHHRFLLKKKERSHNKQIVPMITNNNFGRVKICSVHQSKSKSKSSSTKMNVQKENLSQKNNTYRFNL